MIEPNDNVKGYVRAKRSAPPGWSPARKENRPYAHRCGHNGWQVKNVGKPQIPPLEELLAALRVSDLPDRAERVRTGREAQFLSEDVLVSRLGLAIAASNDPKPVVEAELDRLFEDYKVGELFEHSALVMAILFALRQNNEGVFNEISQPFAKSPAVEIGAVRRFAASLRKE